MINHLTEKFSTQCEDGVVLKGIVIIPENPKAIVQFNGGTAAKKEFYKPFLMYLADHGYASCLWDYRGSGESAPDRLNECNYQFIDYGTKDMPAVKKFLKSRFPNLPYLIFGHSVGGQQVGFMDDLHDCKGMVAFAVSTGYLPHMPISYRLLSWYFFYIFTPLSILLTGFLKARKFGYMEDLPAGVVLQWREWCSKSDYFFNEQYYGKDVPEGNFKQLSFPIHIYWVTDDPISNRRSIPSFWKNIESSHPIEFSRYDPSDLNENKVGHFGFFKRKMQNTLWLEARLKLDQFLNESA